MSDQDGFFETIFDAPDDDPLLDEERADEERADDDRGTPHDAGPPNPPPSSSGADAPGEARRTSGTASFEAPPGEDESAGRRERKEVIVRTETDGPSPALRTLNEALEEG
jgi:hypothetical protein